MAYFSYRQYYPSLAFEFCHKPYSPRIQREPAVVLPLHHQRHGSTVSEHESSAIPPPTQQDVDYVPEGTAPRPNAGSLAEIWGRDDDRFSRA